MFRFPIDGQKGEARFKGDAQIPPVLYYYKANAPYTNYEPVKNRDEWVKGLIDITKLQEALLEEEIAVWDLGFKSGLNYMKDENDKTVWIDFGGNVLHQRKQ